MKDDNKNVIARKPDGAGFSIKNLIVPAVILVLLLHALIMANMFRISRFGAQVSEAMQSSFSYLQVSKSFENGSESLSDKANLFVSTGDLSYLDGYFYVLQEMREEGKALNTVLGSSDNVAASEQIATLLRDFEDRVQTECHAMRLCAEAYGVNPIDYPRLAETSLTDEELALSSTEQKNAAQALLADPDYMQVNANTHEHIGRAIRIVSEITAQKVAQHSAKLEQARRMQWIIALLIIVLLSAMMVLLFIMLLTPMERSVEMIAQGEPLPTNRGVSEFRRLATSYNELLHHKKMTESYLRKQSQTDALTKLPNRLAFQDYISQLSWDRAHSAVTVFSLDVNGLKEANDNHGHAYGDELLRRCASCILSVFGDEPGKQCFRFGGDEFAAFWVNVPEDEVKPALEKFRAEQAAHNVSVSVGYASTEDLSQTSVEDLFEQADKCMYEEKARHHKEMALAK